MADRSIQLSAVLLTLAAMAIGGCSRQAPSEPTAPPGSLGAPTAMGVSDTPGTTKRDHRKVIGAGELYFHVQTYSPGAPYFLYLNGGPGDVSVRGRASFEASDLRRNIIFLDQRGCGRSARDVPREAFRFENLIADIDGVLDALGQRRVILLGHSWGATYGLLYAIARPQRVIALVAMSPVDSWQRALDRYYTAAPAYARAHLELLTELNENGATLPRPQYEQLARFCGFMASHHQEDAQATAYARCAEDPTILEAGRDIDAMIDELRADLAAIARHAPAKNRWPGWSARSIRKKYGLYRYAPACDATCARARQLVAQLYTADELQSSKAMEEGLWINEGWGEYDALRELPKLRGEYFYLYGAHDVLFGSAALADRVSARFGSDHVIRFEDAGHSPASESPDELRRVLRALYTRVTAN